MVHSAKSTSLHLAASVSAWYTGVLVYCRITQSGNQDDRSQLPIVYEVRSLPMTILVTALRNKETKSREFRHFADRAIRYELHIYRFNH